ncbi:ATP-binding protein [Micromonospora sp. RTGN7]|uniref:ATP-binding protein n=1 Tax=Micromonospora sp. RTGN7 TaxID=3016526 RepID=UPI0029FEE441|nr:LuxR C-terminal-related transcriptional regulator [Micromonospora sp. RTGN7]
MNADSTELLLDRECEIERIRELVADAQEGRSSLLIIEGGYAEGKTALLNYLVATARRGDNKILFASGGGGLEVRPFETLRELFQPAGIEIPLPVDVEGSETAAGSHRGTQSGLAERRTTDEMFASLYHQTRKMMEGGPLIIVIDDLHRVDRESLSWLVHLARRSAGSPLLLALAVNRGEPARDIGLIEDLRDTVTCTSLHLTPLSRNAGRELVESHCRVRADDDFVTACLALTGGTAGFANQLCRMLSTSKIAPTVENLGVLVKLSVPRIAEYVANRLNRLSPHALDVARAIAVLDSDADISLIAALCSLEKSITTDVILLMAQAGFLNSTIAFANPIVQTSLYGSLAAGGRRSLHHKAGSLLAEGAGHAPRRVAFHLLALGVTSDPDVVRLLALTASELAAIGDDELSIACLERAMQGSLSPAHRARLAMGLGVALRHRDVDNSIRYLQYASASMESRPERLAISWHLATGFAVQGDFARAIEVLSRHLIDSDGDDQEMIAYRDLLSMINGPSGAGESRLPMLDSPHQIIIATRLAWSGRQQDQAVAMADEFLFAGHSMLVNSVTSAFALLVLLYADRLDLVERHLADVEQQNHALLPTEIATLRCQTALRRGDLESAEAYARAAMKDVNDGLPAPITFHEVGTMVDVLLAQGEYEEAGEMLSKAGLLYKVPNQWRYHQLLATRGRLRVARGDVRAGLLDLLTAGNRLTSLGVVNPAINPWLMDTAVGLAQLGHDSQAQVIARRQVASARGWGGARLLGQSLHTLAQLEPNEDDALQLMQEAVSAFEGSYFHLDLGRTLVDLGRAQTRAGRQRDARDSFRRGLDMAHRCGAEMLAEQAHVDLVRSGGRPRRRAQSGRDALTPTEERIAQMVVGGKTNREIAQDLFVSLRTIELHLTNIYRKFRILGRSELVAAMDAGPRGVL